MKILYYLERWSSGGIEAFVTGILERLYSRCGDFNAEIAAHRIEDSVFTERLCALGVKFHELSGKIRSPKNARALQRLLKEGGFDAVHFNVFHAYSHRMMKAARKEGVKVRISHAHGAGLRKLPGYTAKTALSHLGRALWTKEATHRLACSQEAARFIFGNRDAVILKNGINCSRFAFSDKKRTELRARLAPHGEILLGHAGRFSEEKNHPFLFDIVDECRKISDNVRLVLLGDGPLYDEMRRLAEQKGIADSVDFCGAVPNVEDYMSAMDVFLFPSISEGFGIVAIEAQASGLPTLISDGVPEAVMLTDRAVRLPLDSARSWAEEAIQRAMQKSDRCGAYEEVSEAGYDIETTVDKLVRIYGGEND